MVFKFRIDAADRQGKAPADIQVLRRADGTTTYARITDCSATGALVSPKRACVDRRPAAPARGALTFTGTNDLVLPAGLAVRLGNATVVTTAGGTIAGGTLTVAAEAEIPGTAANLPSGTVLPLVAPIAGLAAQSATVAAPGAAGSYRGAPASPDPQGSQILVSGGRPIVLRAEAQVQAAAATTTAPTTEATTTTEPTTTEPTTTEPTTSRPRTPTVPRLVRSPPR